MTFWTLPGAIRYVGDIEQALRLGHNVVVRFPGDVPPRFRDVLLSALGGWGLRPTTVSCRTNPAEYLRGRFAPHVDLVKDDIQALHESEDFSARLMWLEGTNDWEWDLWCEFLESYADASKPIPLERRTLFVVLLAGTPPADPAVRDSIRTFDWDDVIDEVDILSFANDRLRREGKPRLLTRLLATTVSSLAVWSYDTAERLLDEQDNVILNPLEMLRSWARGMGWDASTQTSWEYGTASRLGVAHAARAAIEDPPKEIERRLWMAQTTVLLPEIQFQSRNLIEEQTYHIRGWLRKRGQGGDDPLDLEIGDLHKIFQARHANRGVREKVRRLRHARNELAHNRHLPPDSAISIVRLCDTA